MVWQHFAHCTCFVLYLTLLKYSTLHIFHALLGILHCSRCSILHIPCFFLYFALLTLQDIAFSMLCSIFCTAHIAAHCIFHALLCILQCLHCRNLHISYALFCISHCSIAAHCSKLIVSKRQCTQRIANHKIYTFPLHNTFQNA